LVVGVGAEFVELEIVLGVVGFIVEAVELVEVGGEAEGGEGFGEGVVGGGGGSGYGDWSGKRRG